VGRTSLVTLFRKEYKQCASNSATRSATEGFGMSRDEDHLWFVYIVRCRDGSLYTGITTDLFRRLRQHNAGRASRYTRSRVPIVLVFSESGMTRSEALRREAAIKRMKRRDKKVLLAKRYEDKASVADYR
jgi:putative endonuclease